LCRTLLCNISCVFKALKKSKVESLPGILQVGDKQQLILLGSSNSIYFFMYLFISLTNELKS
jgi:hypothetical protein